MRINTLGMGRFLFAISLVISNKMIETEEEASQNDQTGYGLGLELTGQLVKRIGWKTEQQIENGRFIAILKML